MDRVYLHAALGQCTLCYTNQIELSSLAVLRVSIFTEDHHFSVTARHGKVDPDVSQLFIYLKERVRVS